MHWGPHAKQNAFARSGRGAVLHSAEGSLSGALGILDGPREVSWHFTVALDGTLYQHYDTIASCWHAHAIGNVNYIGVEHENAYTDGQPNHEPFTDAQVNTDVRLLQWLNEGPYALHSTLWEHNWIPGNPTSCPDGRVPWEKIMAELNPQPTPPLQPSLPEIALAYARTYLIMSGADPATQDLRDAKAEDISALEWVVNTANGR